MRTHFWATVFLLSTATTVVATKAQETPRQEATPPAATDLVLPPTSVSEARSRAMLLHQTIDGALKVVHRDFFDEDAAVAIPSASLEDVFHALNSDHSLVLRWLIVDTDVVNVDHRPTDDFEHAAVKALAAGAPFFEAIKSGQYRYAGAIRLASQCLKCHVQNRTSTEDRTAGLLIAMPTTIEGDSPEIGDTAQSSLSP